MCCVCGTHDCTDFNSDYFSVCIVLTYVFSDHQICLVHNFRQISSLSYLVEVNWTVELWRKLVVLTILTPHGNQRRVMCVWGRYITDLINVFPSIEERWLVLSKSPAFLIEMVGLFKRSQPSMQFRLVTISMYEWHGTYVELCLNNSFCKCPLITLFPCIVCSFTFDTKSRICPQTQRDAR